MGCTSLGLTGVNVPLLVVKPLEPVKDPAQNPNMEGKPVMNNTRKRQNRALIRAQVMYIPLFTNSNGSATIVYSGSIPGLNT